MVESILDGVKDVDFVRLNSHDVVRHKLVGRIVAAYDKYDADREAAAPPSGPRRSGA